MLMFLASAAILRYALPVPDFRPFSNQIPYYTNVRKMCRCYNMFYSVSFVMYNVESVLSSYVVWRNDILIYAIRFDGFILLGAVATLADISMSIKLRAWFFSPYCEYLDNTDIGQLLIV